MNAQPEQASYTLTLGGRFAGTQEWVIRPDRGSLVARVQTDFGGVLPVVRRIQESRMHARSGASLAYAEADGHTKRPGFETVFDERSGLITLRQGKDEAHKPLVTDHHDPLSLLLWLRDPARASGGAAQMVGGVVHVQALPETEVQGVPVWSYLLRPGGSHVYVEQAPPYRLLRLVQPTDYGSVETTLDLQSQSARPRREQPAREQRGQPRRRPRK
ncbi:hypothetical protein [Deinococcus sonorensis]|uniref:DUF3108 domain-containing protein n=2 Tax=Deinococcus sonorensis TaxID=309891 RepID=A0AAU7U9M7_9DEIO